MHSTGNYAGKWGCKANYHKRKIRDKGTGVCAAGKIEAECADRAKQVSSFIVMDVLEKAHEMEACGEYIHLEIENRL